MANTVALVSFVCIVQLIAIHGCSYLETDFMHGPHLRNLYYFKYNETLSERICQRTQWGPKAIIYQDLTPS